MRQKPGTKRGHGEKVVKEIRRATRKQYSSEEKIRLVLADFLTAVDSVTVGQLNRRNRSWNVVSANRKK